jgi:hypothetical protein
MWHVPGERKNAYLVFVGEPEERIPLQKIGVDARIILKLIIHERNGGSWLD